MHADMETHSAAKLNMPHLRRDCGTGARSALNSRLCPMPASTSGALAARPDSAGMTSANKRHQLWEAPVSSSKRQHPSSREIPSTKLQSEKRARHYLDVEVWSFSGCWSLEFGAFHARCFNGTTRRSPGPVYLDHGRMSRLFASCSMTCAVMPVMRAITKMGVNMSISMPIMRSEERRVGKEC